MAHFVALEANKDPLPSGDDPRPDDEAEEDETRSVLAPVLRPPDPAEAKPDSLCSWPESPFRPALVPLEATTIPVRLSIDGVGEAAELTRTPLVWWCCKVAAISDCKAINLQIEK